MRTDDRSRRPWGPDALADAARRVLGTSTPTDPFSVAVMSRAGDAKHVRLSAANDTGLRELGDRDADAAVDRLTDLVAACTEELGADHPDTLVTRGNLAVAQLAAGRVKEAVDESVAVLTDRGRVLGADHPSTLNARNALGLAHLAAGDPVEAWAVLETARSVLQLDNRRRRGRRSDLRSTTCRGLLELAQGAVGEDARAADGDPARTRRPDTFGAPSRESA